MSNILGDSLSTKLFNKLGRHLLEIGSLRHNLLCELDKSEYCSTLSCKSWTLFKKSMREPFISSIQDLNE